MDSSCAFEQASKIPTKTGITVLSLKGVQRSNANESLYFTPMVSVLNILRDSMSLVHCCRNSLLFTDYFSGLMSETSVRKSEYRADTFHVVIIAVYHFIRVPLLAQKSIIYCIDTPRTEAANTQQASAYKRTTVPQGEIQEHLIQ